MPEPAPVLVAVAHGSADPRASATIAELMTVVAERAGAGRPEAPELRAAFLGHAPPSLPQVLSTITGDRQVRVLPLLLTAAYHSKADIPRMLARAAEGFPGLRISYGATLGPHPLLLRALERRLAEADGSDPGTRADRVPTGVVLAAACAARILDWVGHQHCCQHDGCTGGWLAGCCSRSSTC